MSTARKLKRDRRRQYAAILVVRVGHARDLPPGCQLADCTNCKAAVWVTGESLAMARAAGLVPYFLCDVCTYNRKASES